MRIMVCLGAYGVTYCFTFAGALRTRRAEAEGCHNDRKNGGTTITGQFGVPSASEALRRHGREFWRRCVSLIALQPYSRCARFAQVNLATAASCRDGDGLDANDRGGCYVD